MLTLWLLYTVTLVNITYPFFEGSIPLVAPIIRFVCPAVYALSIGVLPILNRALDGDLANGYHYILMIFAIELGVGLGLALFQLVSVKLPKFDARKTITSVIIFIGMLFISLPHWAPQALFGLGSDSIILEDLTLYHRLLIYGLPVFMLAVHFLFRRCEYEQKRYALIFTSLATMITFCYKYTFDLFTDLPVSLVDWPLHLCNTAMFLTPLCLVFKMKRLFNFCLFINVLGAFFAMLMPHALVDWTIVGTERVSYWVNHYAAFAMPLLIASLNIFKRPKFRQFVYAVIALTAYFGLTLFLNAYLTQKTGNVSDFFFTNSDFIVSKLGLWAERTRDFTVSFNFRGYDLTFYPVYQAIFLAMYILLAVGVWFLYAILFGAIDKDLDRYRRERSYRKMKKDLKKYLGGKPDTASISGSDAPSLVIKNFSKRYGKNKHYSVNNVSFEVKGGEIFGFLGPNGAGKSTIIKSIVGIQTITSGNIEICGYDVEKQPVAAKMNTAFVPDHYALYENLTGREYINYIADLFEVSKKDRDEFIDKYVDLFQLTGAFDNQMKTYSHGMKQKITIMSALVHNPKVWILDEPLTGLDPTSIHEVKECMKEHAAKGNIVFFSSHIIDVVEKLCDKIAIIKKGQLRAYKSMQELNEEGIELERYYLDIIYDGNDEHVPYTEPEASEEAVEANA